METILKFVEVKDYLTKSNLPDCDYVINPYIGCTHACKYCYASFMKRFTGHKEDWGSFIDIKLCHKPVNLKKIENKSVFLASVTDCYNPFEEEYQITRKILEQLVHANCHVGISTKSKLILRDLDLLRKIKDLTVSISINTLDEKFREAMDQASSIQDRIATLKELHKQGIHTVLFMSPFFPFITDFKAIIEETKNFVDEYWFENLNLRGSYKKTILDYIQLAYPQFINDYKRIYFRGDKQYWIELSEEIEAYCKQNNINYINYFYHEELVKK